MAALAMVVVVAVLSVAVHAQPDQGDILRNCLKNSKLSEDQGKKLFDRFFYLNDIPNMDNNTKEVYYCVFHTMNLADDKYCINWEKVCDWYANQLPDSIREKYMKKYKADIIACDAGCKVQDDMTGMLNSTKCVFDFMRKVPEQMKEFQ